MKVCPRLKSFFWVVILRVPEVQRCRSQHSQTWAEYAHARTFITTLGPERLQFTLFLFFRQIKKCFFCWNVSHSGRRASCWRNVVKKTEPMGAKKKRLFDELDQTHLQRFLSAVILKKSLCVTELILHHKKPFFPPPPKSVNNDIFRCGCSRSAQQLVHLPNFRATPARIYQTNVYDTLGGIYLKQ